MVLEDLGQLRLVADVGNPAGQLRVPAEGVATDGLVVLRGEVDEVVGCREVEVALRGLGGIPLHAVLRGHLTEVGLDDGGRLAGRQTVLVGAGSVVQLSLGLDQSVDAVGGLAFGELGGSSPGGQGRQHKQERRLHGYRSCRFDLGTELFVVGMGLGTRGKDCVTARSL